MPSHLMVRSGAVVLIVFGTASVAGAQGPTYLGAELAAEAARQALVPTAGQAAPAPASPQTGSPPPSPQPQVPGLPPEMAAMEMAPYFTALNHPVPQDTLMVMALSDFQSARSTANFFTGMGMAQYGLTPRWTLAFMLEGQKIFGLPATYGGMRIGSYLRLFPHDRLLSVTVYGEYEGLNGASLYKMEVSGFGGEDLNEPLATARRTPVRTFEQRAILYHDWGRVNLTFNFINETGLESGENDFGYTWGVFRQAAFTAMATDTGMAGMVAKPTKTAPPMLSFQRLGYGLEMIGALGNTRQFGFDWPRQQQYLGAVFSYALSKRWTAHVEPTFGLSHVSDPFVLRMGLGYSIDHLRHR